jgi:hypothetical protein
MPRCGRRVRPVHKKHVLKSCDFGCPDKFRVPRDRTWSARLRTMKSEKVLKNQAKQQKVLKKKEEKIEKKDKKERDKIIKKGQFEYLCCSFLFVSF